MRLEYLAPILRTFVGEAGREPSRDVVRPIAFWPLVAGWGEPASLQYRAGRIKVCADRVKTDPAFLKLFGSGIAATEASCAYELLLELNSFLAVDAENAKNSVSLMSRRYAEMDFRFWPSLIAFPLDNISTLSMKLLSAIKSKDREFLQSLLIEPDLAEYLMSDELLLARLLRGLQTDRERLQMQFGKWDFGISWPKGIKDLFRRLEGTQKHDKSEKRSGV